MRIKKLLLIPVLILITVCCNGQQSDTTKRDSAFKSTATPVSPLHRQDTITTTRKRVDSGVNPRRSRLSNQEESSLRPDSLLLGIDTAGIQESIIGIDSISTSDSLAGKDSLSLAVRTLRGSNRVNMKVPPEIFAGSEKTFDGKEAFFYTFCGLLLLLGLFRTFYSHYFSNIFRVYFNTSLRQSQLSEQLLQARLPSFLLNIFFIFIAGAFVWVLLTHREAVIIKQPVLSLQICIGGVAAIYVIKFCFLKFIGWISGISESTDYYIFIIFLVNKLLSLLLLPFLILLTFGKVEWFGIIETLALLSVGVLIVSRYIKSYALAGHKLSVKPFHFLLFIAGAELMPILVLYKVAVDYLLI